VDLAACTLNGRAGNLQANQMPLWHTTVMLSRFSARLVAASVAATHSGLWAYLEDWWPSICHGTLRNCTSYSLNSSRYAGSPFTCCPTCSEEQIVQQHLVMPVDNRASPTGPFAQAFSAGNETFFHPVKWATLGNSTLSTEYLGELCV
jgi:hypothetical protein